ncbi:MAG: sulfurtransferase TusA family protein [Promethearchaeota archaeon]
MAQKMKKMSSGQLLELLADDEGAQEDVPAWAKKTGNEYLGNEDAGGFWKFYVFFSKTR